MWIGRFYIRQRACPSQNLFVLTETSSTQLPAQSEAQRARLFEKGVNKDNKELYNNIHVNSTPLDIENDKNFSDPYVPHKQDTSIKHQHTQRVSTGDENLKPEKPGPVSHWSRLIKKK